MVTNKVSIINTYDGDADVTVEIKRNENENGSLKLVKATITVFDGELYLTPSELVSLTEILNYIRPEMS